MLYRETFEEAHRFLRSPSTLDDLVCVLSRGVLSAWEANLTMRGYDPDALEHYELRYFPGRNGKMSFQEFEAEAKYVARFLNGIGKTPEDWLGLCLRFRLEPPWIGALLDSKNHLQRLPDEVVHAIRTFNLGVAKTERINDPGNRVAGGSKSQKNRVHSHVKRQIVRLCIAKGYVDFSDANKDEFVLSVLSDHFDEEFGFPGNIAYDPDVHGDPTPMKSKETLMRFAELAFNKQREISQAGK